MNRYGSRKGDDPFRSGFERKIAAGLAEAGVPFTYEGERLPYHITAHYIPDFILPGPIYVEAKGYWTSEDRTKLLLVKQAHPGIDLRVLLQRPSNPIRKGSRTTYADWCEKNGLPWAQGPGIPSSWLPKRTPNRRKNRCRR